MKLRIAEGDLEDDIDITPLIDCIFLLVLFFMVTSSFIEEPTQDPAPYAISLPRTADGSGAGKDEIVTLSVKGTFLVKEGEEEKEVESLDALLDRLRADPARKNGPLVIRCFAEVESASTAKAEDARGFEVTLPTAESPSTIRRDAADRVTVTHEGKYAFKDQAGEREIEDLEKLYELLQKRDGAAEKRPVILRCDARCTVQQMMLVKNVLKQAGVDTIFEEVEVRHGR